MVRVWIEVSLILVSVPKEKAMTHGGPYKFDLLNSLKINTSWENFHPFLLGYQNSMKNMTLARGHLRIP